MHQQFLDVSPWAVPHPLQTWQPVSALWPDCHSSDKSAPRVARDAVVTPRNTFCLEALLCLLLDVMFLLWVALCSPDLGLIATVVEQVSNAAQGTLWMRGKEKKKKKIYFYQNIKLWAIIYKDLGPRPTWPPKRQRGQILHSENSLSGLSLVLWSQNKERIFQQTFKPLRHFRGVAIIYN